MKRTVWVGACVAVLFSACGRLGYDSLGRGVDGGDLGPEITDAQVDGTFDLSVDMDGVDAHVLDASDGGSAMEPGITVTPTFGLTTSEAGGIDTFTIVLDSMPASNVTIALTSSDEDEGTVSPASVIFTTLNWNAPQTVTVTGVDDALIDGNATYTITTVAAVSADADYDGRDATDVTATNVDNETAGVTLNRTSGLVTNEAGGTDTFTVVLNAAPTADVTISLSSGTPLEATVSPSELVFTPLNWASVQTVTATGVDDFVQDGNAPFTIVTSGTVSADAEYMDLVVPDVTGLNHDDETPGLLVSPTSGLTTTEAGGTAMFTVVLQSEPMADVTIPIASTDAGEGAVPSSMLTFTATNWNVPQSITITGVDDAMADGDQTYTIEIGPATSTDAAYSGLGGEDVSVTNTDDESAGFDVTPMSGLVTTEGAASATFTVVLRSLPSDSVLFDLTSTNPLEGTASPATLTFTTSNWDTPQTVTVTGVDDAVADGDQAYEAVVHVASSGDAAYAALSDKLVGITNTDNETAGITVNPQTGLTTTEAGGTATFTIVLNSEPTDDVTIGLSSDVPLEGTVLPASVTFTNANWDTPQTITVTGVNDDVADGSRVYHIVTSDAASTDTNYSGHTVNDVTVTNTDNDSVGVTVAPTSGLTTSEAGSFATFTMVLTSQPTANVTFNLSSSDATEGSVSPASVTFTMGNWMIPQTVTLTGVDDLIADGDVLYSAVIAAAVSADSAYNNYNPSDVTVTNTDNDMAAVVVVPTSGLVTTEAGAMATFTVVLGAEPTSPVTISVSSSDATEGSVSPGSLMFTSLTWNVPQTVTVTGVDDAIDDGDIAYVVTTGAAVSSDSAYSGLSVSDVTVTNTDNDTAGVTVTPTSGLVTSEAGGAATFTVVLTSQPSANVTIALSSSNLLEGTVSPANLTFMMGTWNVAQTVTVTGVDDALADGNIAYNVVTGPAVSTDPAYSAMVVSDVAVTNNDNDAPGVTVNPTAGLTTTEALGTATFTMVLASMPTASVTISLTSSDLTEGTVSPASVTFTTGDWNIAQTVTMTGVNDALDDGDIAYSVVTGNAVSTDLGYSGRIVTDVSVTNADNDTAGVTVTPTSGLVTTEVGGTATFTVVLTAQPTADVTISLTSSDTTEGTVSPASLTFTNMNWSMTQTVTVTGANDAIDDGDVAYSIVTGAAASADGTYSGLVISDVTVTTTDDDAAGVTVTPTSGLVTTELLGTDTFTIVLASQPTADVTISLASTNTLEGTVSPASLTFTSINWNVAQTVTVTGVNDFVDDGDVAYTITTGTTSSVDPGYNGRIVADVAVTNTDNDAAGVTVAPTSGLVTTEALGTDSFTIVLTSQPTAGVSISLASSNAAEGTVAPASVSFTTMNWNVGQTVTVTGVNDFVDDGDVAYSIITGAATSADANYTGRVVSDVSVTNTDDDATGITVTPTSGLTTTEAGATATFTIVLTSQPAADVSITLTSSDTTEGTIAPASVTFTNVNWNAAQTITITGVDDFLDDGDVAYSIVTGAASSTDGTYGGRAVPDVTVTNTDNDTVGITVTPTSGLVTTELGGTATFTIVLTTLPSSDVTISLMSSNTAEGTVSPASITLTPMNWNAPQTVTVTGVNDFVLDGNVPFTIVTGAAMSADATYNGYVVADVSVTNQSTLAQDAYLKASNPQTAFFGFAAAISQDGNTLAVGARAELSNATGINGDQFNMAASNSGAVYVFVRVSGTWSQQAYVKASNAEPGDQFGSSIALAADGNTLVVGADSEKSCAMGIAGNQADNFCSAAGAAYVFVRSGTVWSQQAYVKASNTEVLEFFGAAVALSGDGNTLAVGATYEDSNATGVGGTQANNSMNQAGAVYVFTRTGAVWSQQAYVKSSNTSIGDSFGTSTALSGDGDTLAVGAPNEDSNATGSGGDQSNNSAGDSGAVYVFTRSAGVWTQQAYVKASNTESGDLFGTCVSLSSDGNTLAVSALSEDSSATGINGAQGNGASHAGAAYVFVRAGVVWSQEAYLKASNTGLGDRFGMSMAISDTGDVLIVGAYQEASNATGLGGDQSNNLASTSGAAYVFLRSGSVWTQPAYLKASNTEASDWFGRSVAVSGDASTFAVGAQLEDSGSPGIGGNQADNSVMSAGAVYVF
jgi:hypothetical protein